MQEEISPARWRPATRVAFRFFFSYFALFLIPSRILGWLPFGNWLAEKYTLLWHGIVLWVGHSVLHTTYDISLPEGPVSNSAHATIELGCYLMVFTMNMCFDVHVKAWSLHLLVMSALLVAPDLPRLADVFLFNRTAPARIEQPLFRRRWLALLPHALILLYGLFCFGKYSFELKQRYATMYPPRPPLYGLWSVAELTVDGSKEAPLADPQRWRLLTFRNPGKVTVESAAGTKTSYPLRIDPAAHTLTVGPAAGSQGRFTFVQPNPNAIALDGVWNGHATQVKLAVMPLVSQRFRWVYVFGPED